MNHLFHRTTGDVLPFADRGEGIHVIDRSGKRYLDASSGAAVSCLGYNDPDVLEAMRAQMVRIPFVHSGFFTTDAAEELADTLIEHAPSGLERVYLLSGGSEGIEAALKLARQFYLETGRPERRRVIARWQSYHGNTLGALAAGGNRWRRAPFEPMLMDVEHVSPCFAYRGRNDGETDEQYVDRLVQELEETIERVGPDTVMAFLAETVVGATAGAVPPVESYFARIREICDRYGILLILDEVMCGMGRTGTLHACEQEGIAPDLLVLAKGLGAGYQPIAALLVSGRIYKAIEEGSGVFMHGHTYMAHATACAAALAVQRVIRERNLLDNVRKQGATLMDGLTERLGNHRHVGDIRGRGLFVGIEFVADRATKETFDPTLRTHQRVKREAMERGLMCYPTGGTVDGRNGDHVLLAPPFIINDGHVEEIVEKIGDAIDAATAGQVVA